MAAQKVYQTTPLDKAPLIGVIGGSGLYKLDNLKVEKEINIKTPWGETSSPVTIASVTTGAGHTVLAAFISRHGPAHNITPSNVPARANIAALKWLGVKAVIAFSAVGSLREEIAPGDFVLPSQIIDRTKGIRPSTFFDQGLVAHAMFGDPFDLSLTSLLPEHLNAALSTFDQHINPDAPAKLHTGKTLVVMEGPQFSTRAESVMYRAWGGDIINMSTLPEAKLAREAELAYAVICTSTDYDSWRVSSEPVTVEEVFKTLSTNATLAKHITSEILEAVHEAVDSGKLDGAKGGMKFSLVTRQELVSDEEKEKLKYILPEYFQ